MSLHSPWRWLGLITLGLLLALASSPARAAVDIVDQQIGFGSVYHAGDWTPLRVTLANRPGGGKNANGQVFKGQLRARVTDQAGQTVDYVLPVEVPQPSTKQFELPVLLPSTPTGVSLELLDERGDRAVPIVSYPQQPNGQPFNISNFQQNQSPFNLMAWPLILELTDANVTPPLASWSASWGSRQQVRPEDLPRSFRGYEGVRLLAIGGRISQGLAPEQLKALETWIELGGQLLVVTPHAAAEIKLDPWLAKMLPAEIASTEETDLGELWPGKILPKVLVTHWGAMKPDATILLDTPKGALALARRQGQGKIIALALEPTLAYGRSLQNLLDSLVLGPGREDLRARHYWAAGNVDPAFSKVMILPNVLVVTGLLVLFVIIVGPVNLMILRRRRRLELAWVTIPALSIFFFCAIYGYGRLAKGGAQHYASIDMLHLSSGSSRGWLLWNSIQFSPHDRVYQFSSAEGGAIMPLLRLYDNSRQGMNMMNTAFGGPAFGNPGMMRGGPAIVGGENAGMTQAQAQRTGDYDLRARVPQWQMAFYQGDQVLEIKGAIRGRAVMKPNDVVTLHLENRTEAELIDATLCVGARAYSLGKLKPGETVDREFQGTKGTSWQSPYHEGVALPGDDAFHQNAYTALRNGAYEAFPIDPAYRPQRRCRLIARQTQWTSGARIEPAPQYTKNFGMVEVDLPLEVEGAVTLAMTDELWRELYQASGQLIQNYGNQMGEQFVTLQPGNSVELSLGVPALDKPVRFDGGMLIISDTPFSERLRVRVFNCQTGDWDLARDGDEPGKVKPAHNDSFSTNFTEDGLVKVHSEDQTQQTPNQQQTNSGMMPGMMMPGQQTPAVMERLSIEIKPEWINPAGNFLRLRLESVPAPTPATSQNGMYGVVVNHLGARMNLTGGATPNGDKPSTTTTTTAIPQEKVQ